MKRIPVLLGVALVLAGGALVGLPFFLKNASEECRKLASSPFEPNNPDGVMDPSKIDVPKAYAACSEAVRNSEVTAADEFRMGRVLHVKKSYSEALEWYRKAADKGYAAAEAAVGRMHHAGEGIPKNDAIALDWFRKAAAQGHPAGQNNLGVMYQNGWGVTQNDATALELLQKAASQNYPRALSNLGWIYRNGRGVPQSDTAALKWYRKAADQNDPDAQVNLGFMYVNGHAVPKSDTTAVEWFRKAADQNQPVAQFNLGSMYANGQGVPKDNTAAVEWYRKSADQNYPDAQVSLGLMYADGRGVAKSRADAIEWYRKAATQGSLLAKTNLGTLLLHGNAADQEEALKWNKAAAYAGSSIALNNLGVQYSNGLGVPQGDVEARQYFEQAASRDNCVAMYNLIKLLVRANYDSNTARVAGELSAKLNRCGAGSGVSAAQIAEGAAEARRWAAKQAAQSRTARMPPLPGARNNESSSGDFTAKFVGGLILFGVASSLLGSSSEKSPSAGGKNCRREYQSERSQGNHTAESAWCYSGWDKSPGGGSCSRWVEVCD